MKNTSYAVIMGLLAALAVVLVAAPAQADQTAEQMRAAAEKIQPSLVVVSFYVERDDGSRVDARTLGTVVGPNNLVMFTSMAISERFPIEQYHNFEVLVVKGSDVQNFKADYLGKDTTAQVAFVRVADTTAPALPAVQFESGAKLLTGDVIVSFANLGESDAYKIMTQMGRVTCQIDKPFTMYLTSGLGSQGTPVVTLEGGRVVGIVGGHVLNIGTTSRAQQATTQVIWPTERFMDLVKNPPEGGQRVRRPWLGVGSINPVTKDMAAYYGLGERRGVVIGQVLEGSPAEKATLKATDIILSINGKNIAGAEGQLVEYFQNELRQLKIGQEIDLEIWREGKLQALKVTLAEEPKGAAEAKRYKSKEFGLTVRELVLADTMAKELPSSEKGVTVAFIEQSSWAQDGGLKDGDIIKKVQDRETSNLDQFKQVFEEEIAKKPKEVVLFVLRGKKETELVRLEPRWTNENKAPVGIKAPEPATKVPADSGAKAPTDSGAKAPADGGAVAK